MVNIISYIFYYNNLIIDFLLELENYLLNWLILNMYVFTNMLKLMLSLVILYFIKCKEIIFFKTFNLIFKLKLNTNLVNYTDIFHVSKNIVSLQSNRLNYSQQIH